MTNASGSVLAKAGILSLLLQMCSVNAASCFEVEGYRAGMTTAEIRRIATAQGWQITNIAQTDALITRRGTEIGPSFTFCGGRLFVYQVNYTGSFSTFNRLIETETMARGQGFYSVENNVNPSGTAHIFNVFWSDPGTPSNMRVSFISYGESQFVSRSWNASREICP